MAKMALAAFTPNDGRMAGIALAVSTILAIAFVAHHPIAEIHGGSGALENIIAIRPMDHIVHGALISILLIFVISFVGFVATLNLKRPWAFAGLIVYGTGCLAAIGAALIDGFIIPDLAAHFVSGVPQDLRIAYDLVTFCGLAIQSLSKLGLVLMSGGIVMWSAVLLDFPGLTRLIGVIGLLAGGLPALILLTTGMILVPQILVSFLLAQAIWNLSIATLMIRRNRGSESLRSAVEI